MLSAPTLQSCSRRSCFPFAWLSAWTVTFEAIALQTLWIPSLAPGRPNTTSGSSARLVLPECSLEDVGLKLGIGPRHAVRCRQRAVVSHGCRDMSCRTTYMSHGDTTVKLQPVFCVQHHASRAWSADASSQSARHAALSVRRLGFSRVGHLFSVPGLFHLCELKQQLYLTCMLWDRALLKPRSLLYEPKKNRN